MSFGSKSSSSERPKLPYTPTMADSSVILSGLMGMRPQSRTPGALSNVFGSSSGAPARRPSLQKRTLIGGS